MSPPALSLLSILIKEEVLRSRQRSPEAAGWSRLIFSGWLANIDFLPQWKGFYSDACHLNSFYTAA